MKEEIEKMKLDLMLEIDQNLQKRSTNVKVYEDKVESLQNHIDGISKTIQNHMHYSTEVNCQIFIWKYRSN